jgi:hypothetical protein
MRIRQITTTGTCALSAEAALFYRQSGLLAEGQRADWLVGLGLSCDDIRNLDLRQPLLQEIAEYAGIRPGQRVPPQDAVRVLEATGKVLNDHIQDLESQIWMLERRRASLERKAYTIKRLLRALRSSGDGRRAA